MTPENLRFHAAGHLDAAHVLAKDGMGAAARVVLTVVSQYVDHASVDAPGGLKNLLRDCIADPLGNVDGIAQLEQWFVDPLNTVIEKNGGKF